MNNQTYIPAFIGRDGGTIDRAYTLPQLKDALDFYISFHSNKTSNYTIRVKGSGKLVVEQTSGSTISTTEYWLTANKQYITIVYSKGADVRLIGNVTYLNCSDNSLTTLDVSKNVALTELLCPYNQLTTLDVSHNVALTDLSCDGNQLTTLDVSHNVALTELFCDGNQLTNLDLSHNVNLGINTSSDGVVEIYNNPLWTNGELDNIIAQLPTSEGKEDWGGIFYYCDSEGEEEVDYVLTDEQISALEEKGWTAENNY